jgi:molybdopterin synthase catalytic subunit
MPITCATMKLSSSSRPVVEDRLGEGAVAGEDRLGEGSVAAGEDRPGTYGAAAVESNVLSAEPLDLASMLARAHHPGAGGVVLFSGEVRDNNHGRAVAFLEYEAYGPLASKMIAEILSTARDRWSLKIALACHRTGRVEVGETAVVVITASAHRGEAYAANKYIIDRIKHEVPIWKCEHYTDGSKEWGNNCNCHAVTGDPAKHIYEAGV